MSQMTVEEKAGQLLAEFGWPLYERVGEKVSLTDEAYKVVVEHGTGSLWGFMRADPWTQKTLTNGLNPRYAIEAVNLLQHYCIEKTRLGIPMFLAEECPHGHMAIGTTAFPTGIGQASTWNPDLLRRLGEAQAKEVRKQGGHIGYGPVIDLARDPRWSRVEEGFGEDPYLAGELGEAVVKGMQENPECPVISTVKHFVAYGWTEGGHNGATAHIGEYEMNEVILPPFRKVTEAGLLSMMTSYNEVDGRPCTGNRELITDVLKDTWGFKGFVVSDLFSIDGMTGHGVAADRKQAAEIAFNAGVESDLGGQAYRNLPALLREGKVSERALDEAVRKMLTLKFQWKLFDTPFTDPKDGLTADELDAHRELAREVARQSIVLLKNEGQTLPLRKDIRSIAVIGPNADTPYNMLGDYTAPQAEGAVVTVLDGIRAAVFLGGYGERRGRRGEERRHRAGIGRLQRPRFLGRVRGYRRGEGEAKLRERYGERRGVRPQHARLDGAAERAARLDEGDGQAAGSGAYQGAAARHQRLRGEGRRPRGRLVPGRAGRQRDRRRALWRLQPGGPAGDFRAEERGAAARVLQPEA